MEALHVLALRVRVEQARLEAELARPLSDPDLELDQRERSVVLRAALAEHVEVHAVQHLDAVARGAQRFPRVGVGARSSSIASQNSASPTGAPVTTSPGARSS